MVSERKIFENGGRTNDGACLYYKLTNEPKGSGELITEKYLNITLLFFSFETICFLMLLGISFPLYFDETISLPVFTPAELWASKTQQKISLYKSIRQRTWKTGNFPKIPNYLFLIKMLCQIILV